ncbi:MAG TPA: hypothetical protein VFF36_07260, partial [Planctomycetota bacterium]|nr:hypothetical protein [Planctomycetota bacterium]
VQRERHGVHLSPLHRPSRWTVDRGLFLRATSSALPADKLAAIATLLERRESIPALVSAIDAAEHARRRGPRQP